jgi:hypothetical protein
MDLGGQRRPGALLGSARSGRHASRAVGRAGLRHAGAGTDVAGGRSEPGGPAGPDQHDALPYIQHREPSQQETLWNIGANLNVQVVLEPGLQPGHRLDVFIDGQRKNLDTTSTQLAVPDVFRGIHSVQAVVIDVRGAEVLRSLATTFMVQQASVQNPNSPLARPPQANSN